MLTAYVLCDRERSSLRSARIPKCRRRPVRPALQCVFGQYYLRELSSVLTKPVFEGNLVEVIRVAQERRLQLASS